MKIKTIQHELVVSPKIKKLNYSHFYYIKIKKKIKYKILLVSGGLINPSKALGDQYIPTGVQASYGTYTDKIALNWNTVSGINGYYIYRDSALIGSTTTNYFNDIDSLYGKLFTYNIRSFINDSGNIITTRNSSSVQGWKNLIPPTNLTVSDGVYTDKIVLTWSSVSGATAYKLYRYNDSDPSPVLTYFTSTTNTSYNDTGVSYGAHYYYAVKASCSLGDSEFSDSIIGSLDSTIPDAPLSVAASDGAYTDKIKIVWSSTPRATNYNIYRELNNTTTRINSGVQGISFEDSTALSGITYNYSISASNLAGEGPVSGKDSGWIKLNIPTGLVASDRTYTDRINISWNAVQGATAYKLYKDTNLFTTTTNTQYDDTSVVFGQNYMYSVKASCALGDSDISVEDEGTIAQPLPSSIVTGVAASNALYTDKITVTWNAVSPSGISGYNIYKNSAYNQQIAINPLSPSTYSIEDTAITPGVLYGYSVKIYNRAGEGPVSSGATGWAKLAAPETLHASDALFSDRVRLNWASVNGATLYKMFRGTPTLRLFGTTTNTAYDNFITVYGQNYTYAIKASCALGDSEFSDSDIGSLSASPLVPPEAFVTNISASSGVWSDRIILSWTAVDGISGYNVYRDSSYRGNVTDTSFVDFSINPGVLYEYKVNVTNPAGEGPLSSGVTGWATIIAPTAFSASDTYDDRIRLNWNTVSGATAYKIYKGSPLEFLGVTTNSEYDDFTPTFGQVYNYGVAASCALVDTSVVTDTGTVAQPVPATPTGVNATDGTFTDKIQITWNSVPGVSGYRVNRNGSQIGGTIVTTFDDTSAGAGISFNYSVVAFNKRTSGPISGIDYGFRGIATPTDFAASDAQFTDIVRLSWSAINGATAYFVYKGDALQSLIGSTVGTEFYDLSVTAGQVYNYAVKPSCLLQTGQTSNSDTGYVILPPPTGVSASDLNYTDKIRTIWNAVSGASGYKVYRNSETSSVIVGTTIGTLFDDFSAIPGVSYNIFVTSFNKVPSGTNESVPSNIDFGSVGFVPIITGITPGIGIVNGGTTVTITGNNLLNTQTVTVGGAAGTIISNTITGITFTTPASPGLVIGPTAVTVTTISGTTTAPINSFTYSYGEVLPDSLYQSMKSFADTHVSDLYVITAPKIKGTYPLVNTYGNNFTPNSARGIFSAKPAGRLTPRTENIFYSGADIGSVIAGLTAIAGACATTTYNLYNNFNNLNYSYGLLSSNNTIVESRLFGFTSGITGGKNLIKRPYSFNDIQLYGISTINPLYGNYVPSTTYNSSTSYNLVRNKLLQILSEIDATQVYPVQTYLKVLATAWKYQRQILQNNGGIVSGIKSEANLNALNTEILNNLKILLAEYRSHYPLARSNNGLSISNGGNSSNELWRLAASNAYPMGLCGGVRQTPFPLGATLDYIKAQGVTLNTWSPQGWTADTGMYLFDGWALEGLLNIMHNIIGATSSVDPVISPTTLLTDASWGPILNDVRNLFVKEIFDGVKHTEEGRPWYCTRKYWPDGTVADAYVYPDGAAGSTWAEPGTSRTGTKNYYNTYKVGGVYFYPDPDNKGYITSNQNITPAANRMLAAMYVYPYAINNTQRQGLLAAYNMWAETWASCLERMLYGCTSADQTGHWMEGWGYAAQSMPDFIKVLTATKRAGDRRLWDTANTPDYFNTSVPGISYGAWVNNAWKWIISRIMPNNLVVNFGSCNTAGWETTQNSYQFYPYGVLLQAALASESPAPGTTGSAISELYNWFINAAQDSDIDTLYYYEMKKYVDRGQINSKVLPPWGYFAGDNTFVWKSEHVIPRFHSNYLINTNAGWNSNTTPQTNNNFDKPLIFGIWGKGVNGRDEKTNSDSGHISAYLGDAVLLLEAGEPRAIKEGSGSDTITAQYFVTETVRAKGHNKMQLGERKDYDVPQTCPWSGVTFNSTGGYAFIDLLPTYNTRGLTARQYGWAENVPGWVGPSDGYLYSWGGEPVSTTRGGDTMNYLAHDPGGIKLVPTYVSGTDKYLSEPYQYQIKRCTRGITWSYSEESATIQIEDIVGISAYNPIYPGASWSATGPYATGPASRVYYRFHVGYTGASAANTFPLPKEGTDTGLTLYPISGSNNKTWNVAWSQPIPYNKNSVGVTYSGVDVLMTLTGNQPIRLERELTVNNSFKYAYTAVPGVGAITPSRHYAINVMLGTSGGSYYDENNLKLNTTLSAIAVATTPAVYVAYWKPWIGSTSLSHITPIVWVNGITELDNGAPFSVNESLLAKTTITGFTAIADKFKTIEPRKRVLGTYRYHFKEAFLGSTFDTAGLGLTYSPWFDDAISKVQAEWNPWIDGLVSNGVTFDYWAFDVEAAVGSFSNWGIPSLKNSIKTTDAEVLRAITSDARFTQSKHGITSLSTQLQGVNLNAVLSGANSGNTAYLAWNKALNSLGVAGLNRALWNYTKAQIPGLRGSNYDCVITTNNPPPDLNGHQQPFSAIFGTAASPYVYGELSGILTSWSISDSDPTRLVVGSGGQQLPLSAWTAFVVDQQETRSCKRSSPSTPLQPWINGLGYTDSKYNLDRRYYYENITHTFLLGAEIFYLWNGADTSLTPEECTAHGITLNSHIASLNTLLGGKVSQSSSSSTTAISYRDLYVTTGAKLPNNTYIWRTTFNNQVIQAINNTTGITYALGGLTCGIWDTATTDTPPSYTVITEIPVIQNYASYNLRNTTTLASTTGCTTRFSAPTYVFPSWDYDIKLIPGISFGKITINDFKYLRGITNPNSAISSCAP